MKKGICAMLLVLGMGSAYADDLVCVYQAEISVDDKYNSSGEFLETGYTKNAVAAVIRQDRANFYKFNPGGDPNDSPGCVFQSQNRRAYLEKLVRKSRLSPQVIRRIIDENPVIEVQVYSKSVRIEIVE